MNKTIITQKSYAMMLVPLFTITLICNFLLYIDMITAKPVRVFISGANVAVLIVGFITFFAVGVTKKPEPTDELTVLNRFKSLSATGIMLFTALMVLYVVLWGGEFNLRINMYLVCAVLSAIIIVEEALFLWFDRTPKEEIEEE